MSTRNNTRANKRANKLNGADWLRHSFSVWRNLDKNSEERRLKHPAMFTTSLVDRLLNVYSRGDGVLLDPFAGSGTALLSALRHDMKAIGCDINPGYRDLFISRTTMFDNKRWHYHVADARRLRDIVSPASVDICVTSPPYWDILNRRRSADGKKARPYSDITSDLGNIAQYDKFLACLGKVFAGVRAALKPNAPFILNVMDLRKGARFYPLHIDTTEVARKNNLVLQDIIIWDRQGEYNNLRPLGYPYKFIVNKVHEYLLVFR